MKRKINEVGTGTLTVSLPSRWVKENNLKKGDEVEVVERGKQITITGTYQPEFLRSSLDVTGQNIMAHRIIAAAYKAGYDECVISYSSPDELKIIQDRIERNLTEFDIVEYKKDKVIVKSASRLEPSQFQTLFKKTFFSLKDSADDCLKALKEQDYDLMRTVVIKDKTIDKYADFCRRLLNRGVQTGFKRPHAAYYIIEETEIVADMYKELCGYVEQNKIKVSPALTELLKEINNFLSILIQAAIKFDFAKLKKFGEQKISIDSKVENLYQKVDKDQLKAFFILLHISNTIFEMKSAILTENV